MAKFEVSADSAKQAYDARLDLINELKAKKATATGPALQAIENQLNVLIKRPLDQDVATATLIDKELSNATARSEEGIGTAQQEYKDASAIKTSWSPNDNINEMMEHLDRYNIDAEAKLIDITINIKDVLHEINQLWYKITYEILPNCPNENIQRIKNDLSEIEEKIQILNGQIQRDLKNKHLTVEQGQKYIEQLKVFRDDLKSLSENGMNTAN